ncbi:luciferin 4-monooxygenase-like [Thrips palmi]|uniref:Luciferin 4-monooxygenase-like n=1 Tax=Thrips palmi TaxID=161013 RepID=A0A6P8ZYH8_THRPL|nr:luciferin 4-monooxygenase-like [Thrips palmi]
MDPTDPMDPPRVHFGGPGVEHPGVSLSEFTLQHLRHFAAQGERAPPAQVDAVTGQAMSYGELLERSVRAAQGWSALGLRVGDTVAVCSNNLHALFPTVLGAMFNGCTVAGIVPSSNTAELLDSLLLVSPRAVISDELTAPRMAAASGALAEALGAGPVKHVVAVAEGRGARLAEVVPGGVMSSEDLFAAGVRHGVAIETYAPAAVADAKQHVAYILFSSGTTGKPKAVMTSDHSMLIHTLNPGSWAVLEGERFLVSSPLSWISGALMMFHCAFVGATRVFLNGCADEHTWLGTVHKYKINLTFAPPWLLSLVPSALSATVGPRAPYDVSSLRAVTTGGAALGADMHALLQAALGCPVAQGYGCTEAGVAFSDSAGLPGQPPPRPGSLGRLQPWVHLRLVDPVSGRDVSGEEGEGELRYKTPYLMLGYVGDPKASAQGFDEHGFYCTGDLVRRDSDGYFYFVDRIKELMKYNSWPIAASELEEVLLFHSLVREVCVLGRPHPIHGDLPTAFVVRSGGAEGDAHLDEQQLRQDINQLVRARLSDHKLLRGGIYFVDEIPKTTSGKKDRNRLRERLVSAEEFAKLDTSVLDQCVYLENIH